MFRILEAIRWFQFSLHRWAVWMWFLWFLWGIVQRDPLLEGGVDEAASSMPEDSDPLSAIFLCYCSIGSCFSPPQDHHFWWFVLFCFVFLLLCCSFLTTWWKRTRVCFGLIDFVGCFDSGRREFIEDLWSRVWLLFFQFVFLLNFVCGFCFSSRGEWFAEMREFDFDFWRRLSCYSFTANLFSVPDCSLQKWRDVEALNSIGQVFLHIS